MFSISFRLSFVIFLCTAALAYQSAPAQTQTTSDPAEASISGDLVWSTDDSMLYYFRKRGQTTAVRLLKAGFVLELALKWAIRQVQRMRKSANVSTEKARAYPRVIAEVIRY